MHGDDGLSRARVSLLNWIDRVYVGLEDIDTLIKNMIGFYAFSRTKATINTLFTFRKSVKLMNTYLEW